MPVISDRAALLKELDFALMVLASCGKEKSKDFKEIIEIRYQLSQSRNFYSLTQVPKSCQMERMMFNFPDRQF